MMVPMMIDCWLSRQKMAVNRNRSCN